MKKNEILGKILSRNDMKAINGGSRMREDLGCPDVFECQMFCLEQGYVHGTCDRYDNSCWCH